MISNAGISCQDLEAIASVINYPYIQLRDIVYSLDTQINLDQSVPFISPGIEGMPLPKYQKTLNNTLLRVIPAFDLLQNSTFITAPRPVIRTFVFALN